MQLNKPNIFRNSEINLEIFLRDYWHKKPLLLKNAIDVSELDILPNKLDLLELSCYEDLQSRVVLKNSETSFRVEQGPFIEEDLAEITQETTWNILISDVEKWCPETHKILKHFNFIRSWLFDDLMMSCGSVGGTVGPHLDNYDVFLLQSKGQRKWQYSTSEIKEEKWIKDNEIKVLENFKADVDEILNPGDILYLPPKYAHYGQVYSEDCVTCSIGLRTPSVSELLVSYVEEIAKSQPETNRFLEPELTASEKSEFNTQDLNSIKNLINNHLVIDPSKFNIWFGKFITEYRSLFYEFNEPTNLRFNQDKDIHLHSFSKCCYQKFGDKAHFFANGEHYICSLSFAKSLTNDSLISASNVKKLYQTDLQVLQKLFRNGTIVQST